MSTSRRELLGKDGEWLLLLTVAGQTFRFATAPVRVFDGPRPVRFAEGLSELVKGLAGDGSPTSSVALEIVTGAAWDEIVGNYATIERARGELRRWFPGQKLSQTSLVLSGFVRGFAYGERDQAVSLSLVRDVRTNSRMLPAAGAVVDDSTWPVRGGGWEPDESIIGAAYPLVIGRPGFLDGVALVVAYEGLLVEVGVVPSLTSRVLVAGHAIVGTEVTLFDLTDPLNPQSDVRPVLEVLDGVGRRISYVEVGASLPTADPGRVYYVSHSTTTGGGLPNPKTGLLLRGAGDYLEWLLETWTDVRIDAARFAGVRGRLNQYKADTFVTVATNPLDLVDKLTSWLPVEPRQGEDGLYFYLRPLGASPIQAVTHLNADAGQVDRATLVQVVGEQIVNEVTVEYAPNNQTGRYLRRVTVSADDGVQSDELGPNLTTDDRIQGNYRAKLSQQIYGRQPLPLQLDDVWETATAVLVAQDIIEEQAFPRRFVDYEGPPELEALEPGSLVTITDSTVGLTRELALLFDVDAGGPTVLLHLELLDDPATLRRFVAS